ncbi:MAG: LysR family transcriptional regulator, partial [Verrucomicrobiota bacterium]
VAQSSLGPNPASPPGSLLQGLPLMKSPIDSRQLHAFFTLARTGSFTQSARELFLTQSAVSHSIKALETDMGCRLFDRVGKTVMLTQAGEQLLPHAERVLREMENARSGIQGLRQWGFGRLRVASPSPLGDALLPGVMAEVRRREPKTLIRIEAVDDLHTTELLERRSVDLVMGPAGKPDERFAVEPFFQEDYVFVVPSSHPWARLAAAPLDGIGPQAVVAPGLGTAAWRYIDEFFRADLISLNVQCEAATPVQALALVRSGLGVALVPSWAAPKPSPEVGLTAVPLGRRRLRVPWVITHWRGRRLSLPEALFIDVARQHAAALSGDAPARKGRASS